jgi:hypothetical protein
MDFPLINDRQSLSVILSQPGRVPEARFYFYLLTCIRSVFIYFCTVTANAQEF